MKKGIASLLAALLLTGCSPMFAGDTAVNLPEQEKLYNAADYVYTYNRPGIDTSNAPFIFQFDERVPLDRISDIKTSSMGENGMFYAYQAPIPNDNYDAEQAKYDADMVAYTQQQQDWVKNGSQRMIAYGQLVSKFHADVDKQQEENKSRASKLARDLELYKAALDNWNKQPAPKPGEASIPKPREPQPTDDMYRPLAMPTPPPPAPKAPVEPTPPPAERMLTEVVYVDRWEMKRMGSGWVGQIILSVVSPPSSTPSFFFQEIKQGELSKGMMLYFAGTCYYITWGQNGKLGISYEYNIAPYYSEMLDLFKKKYGDYHEVTIISLHPSKSYADGLAMSIMLTTNAAVLSEEVTEEQAQEMSDSLDAGSKYASTEVYFEYELFRKPTITYTFDSALQYIKSIQIDDDTYVYDSALGVAPLRAGQGQELRGGYVDRSKKAKDEISYMQRTTTLIGFRNTYIDIELPLNYEGEPTVTQIMPNDFYAFFARTYTATFDNYWSCLKGADIYYDKMLTIANGTLERDMGGYKKGDNCDAVSALTYGRGMYGWHRFQGVNIKGQTGSIENSAMADAHSLHLYQGLITAETIPIPYSLQRDFSAAYVAITEKEIFVNMRTTPSSAKEPNTAKWVQYLVPLVALSVASGNTGGDGYMYTMDDTGEQRIASEVGQVDLYSPESVTILDKGEFLFSSLTNGVVHWKADLARPVLPYPTYRTYNVERKDSKTIRCEVLAFEDTSAQYTYADLAKLRWITMELELPTR